MIQRQCQHGFATSSAAKRQHIIAQGFSPGFGAKRFDLKVSTDGPPPDAAFDHIIRFGDWIPNEIRTKSVALSGRSSLKRYTQG